MILLGSHMTSCNRVNDGQERLINKISNLGSGLEKKRFKNSYTIPMTHV